MQGATRTRVALRTSLVAAVLAITASTARAVVTPDKPSNLVTLVSIGDTTPCEGAPRFGRRILPDGSFVEGFEIPDNQVLVITAVEVSGQGFSANRRQPIHLTLAPSSVPFITIYDQVDALGFVGSYQAISPVPVAAGKVLCLDVGNGLTTAKVYGFLTKDR